MVGLESLKTYLEWVNVIVMYYIYVASGTSLLIVYRLYDSKDQKVDKLFFCLFVHVL